MSSRQLYQGIVLSAEICNHCLVDRVKIWVALKVDVAMGVMATCAPSASTLDSAFRMVSKAPHLPGHGRHPTRLAALVDAAAGSQFAENRSLAAGRTAFDDGVFVTAGSATQKLKHIRHNPYLQYSYEDLAALDGSLVTFGFNFGEQDAHIFDAIKRATRNGRIVANRLWSVYIGVYSDQDIQRARGLARQVKCKVHLFDSKTAGVWG